MMRFSIQRIKYTLGYRIRLTLFSFENASCTCKTFLARTGLHSSTSNPATDNNPANVTLAMDRI